PSVFPNAPKFPASVVTSFEAVFNCRMTAFARVRYIKDAAAAPQSLRICELSLYAGAVASSGDRATRDGPDFRRTQGDAPNALCIRYVERLAVAPHTKR